MSAALRADRVFDGVRLHVDTTVMIADGRIAGLRPGAAGDTRLPPGTLLAPGFIDVQVNGGGDALFNDDPSVATIATIAAAHRRFGTTTLLPTIITDRPEVAERAVAAVEQAAAQLPGIAGIHLEGPFLNPMRRGVHRAEMMRPLDRAAAQSLPLPRGLRALVTVAPEIAAPGAIAVLKARGAIVAAGHSAATAAQMGLAFAEGVTGITHLFNAMTQVTAREPGVVGAALDGDCFAGLIADGHHVADANLRLALKAKGRDRLMLVTDAMPPVGGEGRRFALFGEAVTLAGGRCVTADGTLAGAAIDMAACVRHVVAIGAALEDALIMAALTPARFLGLDDRGHLRPGARADLVALDDALRPIQTWIGGA